MILNFDFVDSACTEENKLGQRKVCPNLFSSVFEVCNIYRDERAGDGINSVP